MNTTHIEFDYWISSHNDLVVEAMRMKLILISPIHTRVNLHELREINSILKLLTYFHMSHNFRGVVRNRVRIVPNSEIHLLTMGLIRSIGTEVTKTIYSMDFFRGSFFCGVHDTLVG